MRLFTIFNTFVNLNYRKTFLRVQRRKKKKKTHVSNINVLNNYFSHVIFLRNSIYNNNPIFSTRKRIWPTCMMNLKKWEWNQEIVTFQCYYLFHRIPTSYVIIYKLHNHILFILILHYPQPRSHLLFFTLSSTMNIWIPIHQVCKINY